jgi:hypothetical protein
VSHLRVGFVLQQVQQRHDCPPVTDLAQDPLLVLP